MTPAPFARRARASAIRVPARLPTRRAACGRSTSRRGCAAPLAKLGLETVGDLLETLPFRHEDLSDVKGLAEVEEGELATVLGRVLRVRERGARRRNLRIVVGRDRGPPRRAGGLVWFNQAFLRAHLEPGVDRCWPAATRAAAPPAWS